jgi:hypothetical protein
MKLDHIALDRLSISPANMRSGQKPPDISGILPSIRARDIIMPPLVPILVTVCVLFLRISWNHRNRGGHSLLPS